ncbi:hypothetical protein ERJ75_001645700 [Trypanosoma vivax]|nr:hypothetical protein TRVL_04640 [Trypanosoma vivax]KAH8605173.1 hypothetical protein ERJ75_001645700 [Trypanosoma vivax]
MRPIRTVKISDGDGTCALDGCVAGNLVCFSLSNRTVRCYDVETATALHTFEGHTCAVRDITVSESKPHLLYSAQEDTGVMISDTRQRQPVRFLGEFCGSGATGGTVGVTPSGRTIAVAVNGDVHIVETRTWCSTHIVAGMHLDEITRVRFISEEIYCSAGEDQMINFIDAGPTVQDSDILLQGTVCGEVVTKMTAFFEHNAVGLVGSCENAYVFPFDLEENETRYTRASEFSYCVDVCALSGQLNLVSGVRDEEGNAGALTLTNWNTRTETPLQQLHTEISRVAVGVGERLVTAGEDGLIVFWSAAECGDGADSPAISSGPKRGDRKGAAKPIRGPLPLRPRSSLQRPHRSVPYAKLTD